MLNANVSIGLAHGAVFSFLRHLFDPIYVPAAVVQEVVVQGHGRPGAAELQGALGIWITEVTPSPQAVGAFSPPLRPPDAELLAVAVSRGADFVLSADRVVRREAAQRGLTCLTAAQVVVLLKGRGHIPLARAVLDRMRAAGFGMAELDYQQALTTAGE